MAEHPQKTDQYGNWEAKEIEDEHEDQESSNTSEWMTDVAKPAATLYALLLIISNVALALSTQARRDNHIPVLYTECFDAAIYIVSIIYLGYALLILFNEPRAFEKQASSVCAQLLSCGSRGRNRSLAPESSSLGAYGTSNTASVTDGERPGVSHHAERKSSRGSVYLKMNAILCGVGAMIYSCLEFGVYLNNRKCYEIISGVIPLLLSIYISIQTYFIFLHSKRIIRKHIILNRFGLMHLVATDITMWLRVLIDQTLYEFSVYRSENNNEDGAAPTNSTGDTARSVFLGRTAFRAPSSGITLHGQKVSTDGQATSVGDLDLSPLCAQSDSVLGDVLVNASVFLYPCIIGYAVISAGIVYCVCRNIRSEASLGHTTSGSRHASERRPSEVSLQNCANCQTTSYDHPDSSHRLYWLDCDQAVGGLLGGSVVLAMTIVCLILFFIFKTRNPEQAVLEAQIGESILYTLGIIAVVAAFGQAIRHLPKIPSTSVNWELDTEMLLTSMMGVYAVSWFLHQVQP
ncbi:hypothetical protein RvY_09292 [Ramazzottius varieornatus]|uniref:Uncharacterized protein n=1 Tax=Ramazzottius varieornatus TaxID=947166 RepID=A0A1D1V8W2_RAMVA|nr:hypothetical protein RvY_09292 [Ramazzottius varieornatus]